MKLLARIHIDYSAERLRRVADAEQDRRRALESLGRTRPTPEPAVLRPRLA